MADGLQPTGVDLQVKGFQAYLKALDQIDKKQRAVFDRDFAGGDRSYKQLVAASKSYERQLKSELRAIQKNEAERAKLAEQAEREAQRAAADRTQRVNRGVGVGLAVAGFAVSQAFDLARSGAAIEAQQRALVGLSATYGLASSDIISAMTRASNGVLSNSQIMAAANQQLLLGVARTPAQFEEVTRDAIVLGRVFGKDAPQAIEEFTTALGRGSTQILDNFGIAEDAVLRAQEAIARTQFGEAFKDLDEAQQKSVFIEAALSEAGKAVAAIGDNGDSAAAQIERMGAASENAKNQFALLLKDLGESTGLFRGIADATQGVADDIGGLRAAFGFGTTQDQIAGTEHAIAKLQKSIERAGPSSAVDAEIARLQAHLAELRMEEQQQVTTATAAAAAQTSFADATEETTDAAKKQTDELRRQEQILKQRQQLIRQAESIELSFARAQEDAARNLARAEAKAGQQATRDRARLLEKQAKEFDRFQTEAEKDRIKFEQDAAKKEADAIRDANQQRLDDLRKLQLTLRQAEERFNLDRLQSRRRFLIQDEDLRAEGDILGLRSLRRDNALQQQEAAENFDLQQRQTRDSASEEQRQAQVNLDRQLQQIRDGLEEQRRVFGEGIDQRRAELLASFDEELLQQQQAQAEQREQLRQSYAEQLEDLAFNRQRQLEDLGRSFVEQEGLTQEGAQKIADQLEKAFGVEGVADVIMSGFAERQASNFQQLFADIATGIEAVNEISPLEANPINRGSSGGRGRPRLVGREHGGPVAPGQPYLVGEAGPELFSPASAGSITPAVQTMRMLAGTGAGSANINHNFRGGFHITGSGTITDAQIDQISERVNRDVVENYRIALQRRKGRR